MPETDKVSIIIPAYYADQKLVDITANCLNSLRETELNEIILVDDGSPIRAMHEASTIDIRLNENKGYAGAVNAGLARATGDYLVISNNDIEFIQPGWLDHLLKPLHDGCDIASIRSTDPDGWEVEDKITEGDKFGCIWAMKRIVYKTIGGLDESFGKGYFEDLDYQKRAEEAGFRVAKNHAGLVEHYGKATFSRVDVEDTSYYAAMERFKEKYGKVW